jgi:hypothetical protein
MLNSGDHTASEILKVFFDEIKATLLENPRRFACYAEFLSYLYRNSDDSEADYTRFVQAVGCRTVLEKVFALGERDKTVRAHYEPEANARYLINTIMGYFCGAVLMFGADTEKMAAYVTLFLEDTWNIYCNGQW